uniref:Uncharacterized protein n=1 Tax=Anguilla anguilla TaxID=7936 RepID=A0A0E9RCW1_ANGAN
MFVVCQYAMCVPFLTGDKPLGRVDPLYCNSRERRNKPEDQN